MKLLSQIRLFPITVLIVFIVILNNCSGVGPQEPTQSTCFTQCSGCSFGNICPGNNFVQPILKQYSLCDGDFIQKNQAKQEGVLDNALPKITCMREFGAWLYHQPCIIKVKSDIHCNSTSPPQCFIKMKIRLDKNNNGNATLSFLDGSVPSCEMHCNKNGEVPCQDLYSRWWYSQY